MSERNVQAARQLIADFLQGKVDAVITGLAADVEWEYGSGEHDVPWYQPRRGARAVVGFFEALQAVTFHRFDVKAYLPHGDLVVLVLDSDYSVNATGRHVVYEDAILLMRFDAEGKVVRFAHRVDFHPASAALRA